MGKYMKVDEFAYNQALSVPAKRAWNNLTNIAKRQGEASWLQEQYHDDCKLQAIIRAYMDRCPPEDRKKGNKSKFSMATYKIAYQAVSETIVDNVGELMFEDLYIEEAQKQLALGRRTREQAQAQCNRWKQS
eukprot:15435141-Alexandrium_andersonii.AAC.1